MRGLIGPWSLEEVYCGNPQLTFVTAILYALRLVLSRKMRRGRGKERPGRAPAASNRQAWASGWQAVVKGRRRGHPRGNLLALYRGEFSLQDLWAN